MIEAIEPLMTALQNETAPSLAITADAAAILPADITTLTIGYAKRGIGSAATGVIMEDDDPFVNRLVLTVLSKILAILALVAVFVT